MRVHENWNAYPTKTGILFLGPSIGHVEGIDDAVMAFEVGLSPEVYHIEDESGHPRTWFIKKPGLA